MQVLAGCCFREDTDRVFGPYHRGGDPSTLSVSSTHSRQSFRRTEVVHKVRVEADGRHCSLKDVVRLICGPDDIIRKGE